MKDYIEKIEIKSLGNREVPWDVLQTILLATSYLETLLISIEVKELKC